MASGDSAQNSVGEPIRLEVAARGHEPSLRVFVSSTSEDLKAYRTAAKHAVEDAGWRPRMMEQFGARIDATVKSCFDEIARSDLMLLIVGFRRGWVPSAEQGGDGETPITGLELAQARRLRKPVLVFLAREDDWPGRLYESTDAARAWVADFRANLNQPAAMFDYERPLPDRPLQVFRSVVLNELNRFKAALPVQSGAPAEIRLGTVATALRTGTRIPFIGPGIFGDGPLGLPAIAEGISRACEGGIADPSLATLAEFCERHTGSREDLLNTARTVIQAQTRAAAAGPVHELLTLLGDVPLIVSASFDKLIEGSFKARGLDFIVVSHILRSMDEEFDGKIFVERADGSCFIEAAPELDLRGLGRVIYKPLGSPVLPDSAEPDLGLDIAVLTETDHFQLFRLLQNQQTGVPPAIVKWLKRCELIYIGYALDVWQFRLVTQLLQAVGRRASTSSSAPFAIRRPRDELETLSWRQLGARLIEMDPDQFARGVLAEMSAAGELHV
jgi:hypothetical protein